MCDSELLIREMTVQDIHEVVEIWAKTPNICLGDRAEYEGVIERYLRRNPGLSFIARNTQTSQVVGTLLAGTDGLFGTLRHAVVVEGYRGNGIMAALIEAAVNGLKKYKISESYLYVLEDNKLGLEYFKKNNWCEVEGVKMFCRKI